MKNAHCWLHNMAMWLFILSISTKELKADHLTEEQTVTVNTVKWAHVVSDRFVSITIDLDTLLLGKDAISDTKDIINLAHGLSPSYLRIGGSNIYQYHFGSVPFVEDELVNKTITESQWVMLNDFAQQAGLNIIVCLNARQRLNGMWDPRNALELISFSDKMGYKVDWELGYELQKLNGELSSMQLALDVNRLRNILSSFPHYKHSFVMGPDIIQLYTKQDIDFIRDFIQEAGSSLNAITWHPKYLSNSDYSDTDMEFDYMLERLIFEKESLIKMLGRQNARKPIWIAESNKNVSQGHFLDALNWAQELGTFAGIGIQVVMKQPSMQELLETTPVYWVSLLHKALVGQVVLDVRHSSTNKTNVPVFCHCTNTMKNSKASELITTDNKYEPGAITFFAVNRGSSEITLSMKLSSGLKQEANELHEYLLTGVQTEANPLQSRKVLLNGKLLILELTGALPELSPNIERSGWNFTVHLPPASVGFWVVPRANVKICAIALKKAGSYKNDVQSQHLSKPVDTMSAVNHINNSHSTRNSEIFNGDLSNNNSIQNKEINKEHHIDNGNLRMFKKKKHYNVRNKKFMEKQMQESKDFGNTGKEKEQSFISKTVNGLLYQDSDQLSKNIIKKYGLKVSVNHSENMSIEQKFPEGRFKRYAPESDPISFSGISLDAFQQSSSGGRAAKTKRKKKVELKSDRKEDRELRKNNKLKQIDDNIQATLFDPLLASIDSGEQYFADMKREDNEIRPFPTGSIYLKQGDSSEERRNHDYDYVDRDDKETEEEEDEVDDLEAMDVDLSLKPGEFFEKVIGATDKINEHFVGYGGELWEAETFTMAVPTEKMEDDAEDGTYDHEVIHETGPSEEEDRKRKAAAAKLLNSYLTEGYTEKESNESKHTKTIPNKTRIQRKTERKEEYAEGEEDDYYFPVHHKEKNKKIHIKPHHHLHNHHHNSGHPKSTKESKYNHYDIAHNIHNHREKTRKIHSHDGKNVFSNEDDTFFPHGIHEKERDHKRNTAYRGILDSSEERTGPLRNEHNRRETTVRTQIKNDFSNLNNEYFEGSSTLPKSPRQSRAKKINQKDEENTANAKSKIDVKISDHENNDQISRIYQESSENRKVSHQNTKQQKKKNKTSISSSKAEENYQKKEIHEENKKNKEKQTHSDYQNESKYEVQNKNSERLDSIDIENDAERSKKKAHFMGITNSLEDEVSKMSFAETAEEESEEYEQEPAEHVEKVTTLVDIDIAPINPTKSNRMRSSSEHFEDIKVKSFKYKEKQINEKSDLIKPDSSAGSLNINEKGGYRKSKKFENSSEGHISGHTKRKGGSSRKSQLSGYGSEEAIKSAHPESKSLRKFHSSKQKSETENKNKYRSEEDSLEEVDDNNHSKQTNSLEHSIDGTEIESDNDQENINSAYPHSEPESKQELLSDEDLSIEDTFQNSHKQPQYKNHASKLKLKTNSKHKNQDTLSEENFNDVQSELKKRHASSEHVQSNEESELISEIKKQEKINRNSGERKTMGEKLRTIDDEEVEKLSKEKQKKRKNRKHRAARESEYHSRARREIVSAQISDNGNSAFNHIENSKDSNGEMPNNMASELQQNINMELRNSEMQYLEDNAYKVDGNIITENNVMKIKYDLLPIPQQEVENRGYIATDILEHNDALYDSYRNRLQENVGNNNATKDAFEDVHVNNFENEKHMGTWTFRNANSMDILEELNSGESNTKREVDDENIKNSILQIVRNKEKDNTEQNLHKKSSSEEETNDNQDKGSSVILRDVKHNSSILYQEPTYVSEIHNITDINGKALVQNNQSLEHSRNAKILPNEEKSVYHFESFMNTSENLPIEIANRKFLILGENEFQNVSEELFSDTNKKANEEILEEREHSSKMLKHNLEFKTEIPQYSESDQMYVSLKLSAVSENEDPFPFDFTINETQKPQDFMIQMLAPDSKKEIYNSNETLDENDNERDVKNNKSNEKKYFNVAESMQSERVPKKLSPITENAFDVSDKMELNNYEGDYILNEAEETTNIVKDLGELDVFGHENSENLTILEPIVSSSKELAENVELVDEMSGKAYDQERSARDTNTGESVSLSNLNTIFNFNESDIPTKISLTRVNDDVHDNEASNTSSKVSEEISLTERSSSVTNGIAKKFKGLKTLALPKKNAERLKLEQKYKERIQQLKERRAKIKAELLRKSEVNPIRKSDTESMNKKVSTRRRRAINEDNVSDEISLQHSINADHTSSVLLEYNDSFSVPVSLHKTLMISENNPYYSNEERVIDETEQELKHKTLSSEEVLVKLTAPLINQKPLNSFQQEAVHFYTSVPVKENDINVMQVLYNDKPENSNTKEGLHISRSERNILPHMENKNNLHSWFFVNHDQTDNRNKIPIEVLEVSDRNSAAESFNVNKRSNEDIIIFNDPLHKKAQRKMHILPIEMEITSDGSQKVLTSNENKNDWLIENGFLNIEMGARKEAMPASDASDISNRLLFPSLEIITDIETAEDEYDALNNNDNHNIKCRHDEIMIPSDQILFAARSKRALQLDHDPFNDDLLLPSTISHMTEKKNSIISNLDAYLNRVDPQQPKEIGNSIDLLDISSLENSIKGAIINEQQTRGENQAKLASQNVPVKLIMVRKLNDKTLESSSADQVIANTESINNINIDDTLINRILHSPIHSNSIHFQIQDHDLKGEQSHNNLDELDGIISNESLNKIKGKPSYVHTEMKANEYFIPVDNKGIMWRFLHPYLRNYNLVKNVIKNYIPVKDSTSSRITSTSESSSVENEHGDFFSDNLQELVENSSEIMDINRNLSNDTQSKYFADSKEEIAILSCLDNNTNNLVNKTKTINMQREYVKIHTEDVLHFTKENNITNEEITLPCNKTARATENKQPENKKISPTSHPRTLHNILKELTQSVINFLYRLAP